MNTLTAYETAQADRTDRGDTSIMTGRPRRYAELDHDALRGAIAVIRHGLRYPPAGDVYYARPRNAGHESLAGRPLDDWATVPTGTYDDPNRRAAFDYILIEMADFLLSEARRHASAGVDQSDLLGAFTDVLIEAIDSYNPSSGVEFARHVQRQCVRAVQTVRDDRLYSLGISPKALKAARKFLNSPAEITLDQIAARYEISTSKVQAAIDVIEGGVCDMDTLVVVDMTSTPVADRAIEAAEIAQAGSLLDAILARPEIAVIVAPVSTAEAESFICHTGAGLDAPMNAAEAALYLGIRRSTHESRVRTAVAKLRAPWTTDQLAA